MIGTYVVSPADKTLVFKVDSSTFPNWHGTEQKRLLASTSRDDLKYVTPTASSGGVGTVTWEALSTGATMLVTDDPVCLGELRRYAQDRLDVVGLFTLLARTS